MRLHFHDWEDALQGSGLPEHRKEPCAITIRWYLSWAKRARVPVELFGSQKLEVRGRSQNIGGDLAVRGKVSASTQRQALNALVFLYREALERDLGDFSDYLRARARTNMRTSLTANECRRLFEQVEPAMELLLQVL